MTDLSKRNDKNDTRIGRALNTATFVKQGHSSAAKDEYLTLPDRYGKKSEAETKIKVLGRPDEDGDQHGDDSSSSDEDDHRSGTSHKGRGGDSDRRSSRSKSLSRQATGSRSGLLHYKVGEEDSSSCPSGGSMSPSKSSLSQSMRRGGQSSMSRLSMQLKDNSDDDDNDQSDGTFNSRRTVPCLPEIDTGSSSVRKVLSKAPTPAMFGNGRFKDSICVVIPSPHPIAYAGSIECSSGSAVNPRLGSLTQGSSLSSQSPRPSGFMPAPPSSDLGVCLANGRFNRGTGRSLSLFKGANLVPVAGEEGDGDSGKNVAADASMRVLSPLPANIKAAFSSLPVNPRPSSRAIQINPSVIPDMPSINPRPSCSQPMDELEEAFMSAVSLSNSSSNIRLRFNKSGKTGGGRAEEGVWDGVDSISPLPPLDDDKLMSSMSSPFPKRSDLRDVHRDVSSPIHGLIIGKDSESESPSPSVIGKHVSKKTLPRLTVDESRDGGRGEKLLMGAVNILRKVQNATETELEFKRSQSTKRNNMNELTPTRDWRTAGNSIAPLPLGRDGLST